MSSKSFLSLCARASAENSFPFSIGEMCPFLSAGFPSPNRLCEFFVKPGFIFFDFFDIASPVVYNLGRLKGSKRQAFFLLIRLFMFTGRKVTFAFSAAGDTDPFISVDR